jgi:TonB family protein
MTRTKRLLTLIILSLAMFPAEASVERKVLAHAEAEYPELAQRNNLHGAVKLKIWISPAGEVRRLEYIGGHPVLAEAALKAVKSWKYEQAPQESTLVVEVKF